MKNQSTTPGLMLQQLTDLIDGLAKDPPGGMDMLLVEGQGVPLADLGAELEKYRDMYQAVEDAEEQYRVALSARGTIEAIAQRRCNAVRGALRGTLGKTNPVLSHYGVTPAKTPRQLTADEKLLKVERAKATRVARHTMSKKQKLAIKGTVPEKPGT